MKYSFQLFIIVLDTGVTMSLLKMYGVVLVIFAAGLTTDAQFNTKAETVDPNTRQGDRESSTPVAALLGGDVTFDINGAMDSYCQTHVGRMVYCSNGTTMEGIGQGFQNRISGSCDHIKLKDVQRGDLNHRFICQNSDPLKPASYTYSIKAITAPPQNVSLSVNGSKVSVFWQPPPAHWQTGPILEYEVKWSCNGTELLMNKTVAETSTVLEGLPQEVRCTVSVAAVTSDGVEAWSELKPVDLPPSGSSQNNAQPVEERKWIWFLVVFLVVFLVAFLVVFLVVLLVVLLPWGLSNRNRNRRHRDRNSVSGPKPNEEQIENGCSLVHFTQPQPHVNDEEETLAQTQT